MDRRLIRFYLSILPIFLNNPGLLIRYTPENINNIETGINEVRRSPSAIPQRVATIGIKYAVIEAKTGEVALTSL